MHRNTFILVGILTIVAALVIGVNIGRKSVSQNTDVIASPTIADTLQPQTNTPTPTIKLSLYSSTKCGISFSYPDYLTKLEANAGAAVFIDTQNPGQSIAVTCQAEIPRPPLNNENIETVSFGSMSAKIYHDSSEKDGEKMDKLIFRHPKTKLDTFLSGYGAAFQTILQTLTVN